MEDKRRDYLFDNLKILLIFLVVFGHAVANVGTNIALRGSLYIFIYLFHMPLFVFVSGYFSKNIDKCRAKAIKDLLLPFIVFNLIWYASVGNFKFPIYYPGWTLWYLLSLFVWRFFLKDIIGIKWVLGLSMILGLLVGFVENYSSFLSFSRTFAFLPFFLLGYYTNSSVINKIKAYPKVISVTGLTTIGLFSFLMAKYNVLDYTFLYLTSSYESFGLGVVQGTLLRTIFYIITILTSAFVINLVPSRKFYLSKLGANTMMIYLGHIYMLKYLNRFVPVFDSPIANLGIMILYSILICAFLSLPIFMNIYKFVFGKLNYGVDTLYGKVKPTNTTL